MNEDQVFCVSYDIETRAQFRQSRTRFMTSPHHHVCTGVWALIEKTFEQGPSM